MKTSAMVLLVDDDAAVLAMTGLSLRQAGLSVDTARGGAQALQMLARRDYDWLVTDARMTPMDGFELAQEARRLRPRIRIVMISAIYGEPDIRRTPVEKLFVKPLPVEDLIAWLRLAPPPLAAGTAAGATSATCPHLE